jgi:hypothetical protein
VSQAFGIHGDQALPSNVALFRILTTAANRFTREIHDRMPVILDGSVLEDWLNPEIHEREMLQEDPGPEEQNVVLIDSATLQKTQRMIAGCEACSKTAEIPFDNILDRVTGSDLSVTDYILEVPAKCLHSGAEINEKTLVDGSNGIRRAVSR